MNKGDIINQYKKKKNHKVSFLLKNGAKVVGETVDEGNHLFYVIKQGNEFDVIKANNQPIIEFFHQSNRGTVQVKVNK
jgi:hypothetical protein